MALKISVDLPEIGDITDPTQLEAFVIAVRQVLQEVIAKAQQTQGSFVTAVPATTDFEIESQNIPFDDGVDRREYIYVNGIVRYKTLT